MYYVTDGRSKHQAIELVLMELFSLAKKSVYQYEK